MKPLQLLPSGSWFLRDIRNIWLLTIPPRIGERIKRIVTIQSNIDPHVSIRFIGHNLLMFCELNEFKIFKSNEMLLVAGCTSQICEKKKYSPPFLDMNRESHAIITYGAFGRKIYWAKQQKKPIKKEKWICIFNVANWEMKGKSCCQNGQKAFVLDKLKAFH